MTERMTDEHWAFLRTIDHWSARESDQIEAELDRARANERRLEEEVAALKAEHPHNHRALGADFHPEAEDRIRAIVREEIRAMAVTAVGVIGGPAMAADMFAKTTRREDEP